MLLYGRVELEVAIMVNLVSCEMLGHGHLESFISGLWKSKAVDRNGGSDGTRFCSFVE